MVSNIFDTPNASCYVGAMYAAHELSQAVRTRRQEMGISQQALAKMSGLSRATINQVEGGKVKDLSLTRTAAILESLGLGLSITPAHPRSLPKQPGFRPLDLAARTASVSYTRPMPPRVLGKALTHAQIARTYEPHLATLLDEAPVSLLAKVVEQIHADEGLPREKVWAHMRQLAQQLQATRELWHELG